MLQVCNLNRRLLLFIALCLILVVVAASLAFLYEKGLLTESNKSTPKILWQNDLERFASDFAVADGKVFTSDAWANVYCFDAQNGKSLWNVSIGGYANNGLSLEVYDGKLYVGRRDSVVNRLDMDTGEVELSYQAPVSTSYGYKWSPDFFVADGRVVASQNGIAVYNASDGELFWEQPWFTNVTLGNASTSAPESDYVFIMDGSRVSLNNGSTLWTVSGSYSDPAVVAQDKVLFWNYSPVEDQDDGQILLCVDAASGEEKWSFDVGSRMFQPTVSNDLALFGAEDGYLCAANCADGTLNWRTFADQNLTDTSDNATKEHQYTVSVGTSAVQVDPQNQRVLWSIIASYNGTNPYNATVLSLDLSDGNVIWSSLVKQVSLNDARDASSNITLANNLLYVIAQGDLYCIDAENGSIRLSQVYEHYAFPPIAADGKVFFVADLWLIAYK
jgi:outer membrane protein assembly factor BamB